MNLSTARGGLGACDPCSRIKQKCDGGEPCYRCHRLALNCQRCGSSGQGYRQWSSNSASNEIEVCNGLDRTQASAQPKKRVAVIKRTRNGCLSCKRRRKKCDEILPKCGDCKRLNLVCARTILSRSNLVIPQPQNVSNENTESDFVESGEFSPAAHEARSPEDSWAFEIFDWEGSGSSTLGWKGGTIFVETTSMVPPRLKPLLNSISLQDPFNIADPKDKHLLRHFIRVVSRTLSVVQEDDSNPFLSLIVPLAGSSKVVMESLLALSASHLRRIYPDILPKGLSHQNEALKNLNDIVSNKSASTSEETLAAILLLCMIEICDGNSTKWSWHISAAQTVIRSDNRLRSSSTTTWKFLLAVFGYLDSVITISSCEAPLMTLDELARDENLADSSISSPGLSPSTSHNEALFGIALPLFDLIGKISNLANRRKDRIDEISELWFRQGAARIETNLRDWEPDVAHQAAGRDGRDLIHGAYAIKWASILRLHQVVEGYNRSDPCVSECTSQILDHISEIRFGSPAEHILIFPLVMAASGCQDDEQRITVREKWMVMERTLGFDNIYRAREMVEAVWKTMDRGVEDGTEEGGLTVNWAKIRYYDFPGVVLL